MDSRVAQIESLSDYQILTIVEAIGGEYAPADSPEGTAELTSALQALFDETDRTIDVSSAAQADMSAAAAAGRQLLVAALQAPEMRPTVEEWLDSPPTQEAAALPLIVVVPVVFTASIAFLQIVGHTTVERVDGKWNIRYDPKTKTPFDDTLREAVGVLAQMMNLMGG